MILASSCSCSQEQEPVQPVNPTPVEPTPVQPTVISKEYKLHNWYASFATGLPKLTLTEENFSTTTFPVPTRENFIFNGWYIDEEYEAEWNFETDKTGEEIPIDKGCSVENYDDSGITYLYAKLEEVEA